MKGYINTIRNLKRSTALVCAILLSCTLLSGASKVNVVKCSPKAATAFAIFVDNQTYSACKEEINAYRDVLQSEGLGTYIISSDWERPEDVKAQITALSKRRPALEGMVFIGDIPIARIRRAQFMTTAFKMNENTFPMVESAVTSDRYYDAPDLNFEFIQRDSSNARQFYYNLTAKGSVKLQSKYYSARIMVPETFPGDKMEVMKRYLKRVVAAHKESNPLDNMTFFAGHGYNSDCLTAWRQQPLMFKECFPAAFVKSSGNMFYNFRQDPYMKFKLFNEIQRPERDIFLFYEHGAPDTQYINGSFPAHDYKENIELFKRNVRSAYKRYARKSQERAEKFLNEVCEEYHFSRETFSKEAMAAEGVNDSLAANNINILLEDIQKLKTGAKVVIFNACYNGSFYEPGFVAGYHLFNDGKCIVTQGNTVNVLQDKWADQLIGYLSLGVRIGFWQKEIAFLESHLIGDPTYRFAPHISKEESAKLQISLANLENTGKEYWRSLLKSTDPILRATGIKQLSKVGGITSAELEKIYFEENSWIVRHQALWAIAPAKDSACIRVVKAAMEDPYEMIRRQASSFAGKMGDKELAATLAGIYVKENDSHRINYQAMSSLPLFAIESLPEEMQNSKEIKSRFKRNNSIIKTIMDKKEKESERESAIRTLRNYPLHWSAEKFVEFAADTTESEYLRLVMVEALGWFNYSYQRDMIASALSQILQREKLSPRLKDEVEKTLKRLKACKLS